MKLSAEDYAKLARVSTLTVYNWEHGKTRPRKAQLAALIALRKMGRRDALAKLEQARGDDESPSASGGAESRDAMTCASSRTCDGWNRPGKSCLSCR